jgi:hypothetical protein
LDLNNLELLKIGRHFRIGSKARLVLGRNEGENNLLFSLACPGDYLLIPQKDLAGPSALIRGQDSLELVSLSAQVVAAYTDVGTLKEIEVYYRQVPAAIEGRCKIICTGKINFTHLLI